MTSVYINQAAEAKHRATEDRRAGKCRCGAQMRYTGEGKRCMGSNKSSENCDRNPTAQIVQNMMQSANSRNTRAD